MNVTIYDNIRTMRRFTLELLHTTIINDDATLINNYDKLKGYVIIKYVCKCGTECAKLFRDIVYYGGAYCKQCVNKNKAEKIRNTCMETYGVLNPSQVDEIKEKKKQTSIANYGTSYALQCPEVLEARKKSHLEKYGVDNPSKRSEVVNKIKKTFDEKYGGHPMHNNIIKEKVKNTCLKRYGGYPAESVEVMEKIKNTCLERYGGYPTESVEVREKAKATNIERYGVSYPSQNIEIMNKIQNNTTKYKKYTMPSGTIINVQGYEPYALDILLKLYNETQIISDRMYIPRIPYVLDNQTKYYFPDIYIPHTNTILEIKSDWTYKQNYDKNQAKAEATRKAGYKYEFWIFNRKGERIFIDDDNEIIKSCTKSHPHP